MKNLTTKKSTGDRRKFLLGAGAATGAALVWKTPVINSVILPAHAQTSASLPTSFFGGVVTSSPVVQSSSPILDMFMQTAVAGEETNPQFACSAFLLGENTYEIILIGLQKRTVQRSGILDVNGDMGMLSPDRISCTQAVNIPSRIAAIDQSFLTLEIERAGSTATMLQLLVPVGDGVLPELTGCET